MVSWLKDGVMKHRLKTISALLAVMLLVPVVVVVAQYQKSPVDSVGYQSSVIDTLATPVSQGEISAVQELPEVSPVVSSPAPVPVSLPAAVIAKEVSPAPVASVQVNAPPVSAPIFTTSVGFGGTLANRPIVPVIQNAVISEQSSSGVSVATTTVAVASSTTATTSLPVVVEEKLECVLDPEDATRYSAKTAGHIIIREIFVDMIGGDTQEFVELFNPTSNAISLASSSLQYVSGSASTTASIVKKNFPVGASIAGGGFYLIGMGEYSSSSTADMLWSQSLNNAGATLLFVGNFEVASSTTDQDIIDRLAYGSGAFLPAENLPAPLPPIGSSLERNVDNMREFLLHENPVPKNAASVTSGLLSLSN